MAPPPERRSPLTHRVLLLGAAGYVGRAFARALDARGIDVVAPSRRELDATRFRALRDAIASARPALVINAAGFTGQPNVDACETARADTVLGNVTLPLTVAHACDTAGVAFAHVSSGCIYSGAKLIDGDAGADGAGDGDGVHVVKDLLAPDAQRRIAAGARIAGFVEVDAPNFTFRDPPCSFYSGTKALAEELLAPCERTWQWRLRIPFDHRDGPRNYLSKLLRYEKAYENYNSLSHLDHFVRAGLDLWQAGAPFGTYNLTNPGYVTTREVVALLRRHLAPKRDFSFFTSDAEFYATAAKTPRSNCVLDSQKAIAAGARLPEVGEALEEAVTAWESE